MPSLPPTLPMLLAAAARKVARSAIDGVAALALSAAAWAHAQPLPTPQAPLSADELREVMEEIHTVDHMNKDKVNGYVVRSATPERIQRLYAMPEILRTPAYIRQSGLIFAGQGPMLGFDKPSDVLAKMSAWFPEKVGPTRLGKDSTSEQYLYGPFARWGDEAAAFVGLWHCMPKAAWHGTGSDPFDPDSAAHGHTYLSSIMSGRDDFDDCIHNHLGGRGRGSGSRAQDEATMAELHRFGDRVAVVLADKFANLLAHQGCRGTGPDDCLLALYLWARLSPQDARLASALQALDTRQVLFGANAVIGQGEKAPGNENPSSLTLRSRRQFLFNIQLASVIHHPTAWPASTLRGMLRQMTSNMDIWLDWPLKKGIKTREGVRLAVQSEVDQIGDEDHRCKVRGGWFSLDSPALSAHYAFNRMQKGQENACGQPDWQWLKSAPDERAATQRGEYLEALGQLRSVAVRDEVISKLSGNGKDCFIAPRKPRPAWQAAMCKRWVHEPQATPLAMKNSRLTLDKAHRFEKLRFDRPDYPESGQPKEDRGDWLAAALAPGLRADAVKKVRALAEDLRQQDAAIQSVTQWRHPGHSRSLLEIDLKDGRRLHLSLTPHSVQTLQIPSRFSMDRHRQEIARVSDLDADGNLELWWAESFDDCQGNEGDLQREMDCSAKSADMGEISGDTLSYFVRAWDKTPASGPGENWTSRGRAHPFRQAANPSRGDAHPPCNAWRVGLILSEPLGISFGSGKRDRGEVMGLACQAHPTRPGLTLVTLFHDLPQSPPANSSGSQTKGFVFAVIDAKRESLVRLYRNELEEDGGIRIDGAPILDTAPYLLKPKVRALGVRMDIGYSPGAADGGTTGFLTLFVEEGKALRPVLFDKPMYQWTYAHDGCTRNGERSCAKEVTTGRLAVANSRTDGWQDLDLIETTINDSEPEPSTGTRVVTKLRFKDGRYEP